MIFGRTNYSNDNYLKLKISLCNLFEIWRQTPNLSNQISAQDKSQRLLHNQRIFAYRCKFSAMVVALMI